MPPLVATALALEPWVDWIEQDQEVQGVGYSQFGAPWNLDRVDQTSPNLSQSYDYPVGASGVNVYVVDSGISSAHTDFQGRASLDFTAVNDGFGADDCAGHGTSVASAIGGSTYGIAKKALLHSVRVLECSNRGSVSQLLQGLDWVLANASSPAIANMSVTVEGGSLLVDAAVQRLVDAGIPTVVAAGNGSRDACLESPGRLPAVITVGGSAPGDWMYSFSDYGSCVDLFAPADSVEVATNANPTSHGVGSGTSFASPLVAGAAAMYLAWQPGAAPASVASALIANATNGALRNLPANSANRLLFVNFIPSCGTGLEMCAGTCVDLLSSSRNCGTCGRVCVGGGARCRDDAGNIYFAGTMCMGGRCVSRSCDLP